MSIAAIISECRKYLVVPRLDGADLKLTGETDNLPKDFIDKIRSYRQELIAYLEDIEERSIPVIPAQADYPASNAQKSTWLLSQLEGGSAAYTIVNGFYIKGQLQKEYLQQAFQLAIRQHESLRTSFREIDGELRQIIHPDLIIDIVFEELGGKAAAKTHLQRALQQAAGRVMDLANGPLISVQLFGVETNEYALILALHHIIGDGWSVAVLMQQVLHYYESLCKNETPAVSPLPVQYKDYCAWHAQRIDRVKGQQAAAFWKDQFATAVEPLDLPFIAARPSTRDFAGAGSKFYLQQDLYARIDAFCRQHQVTLFYFFRTAITVLLYKLSGQRDLTIGTPVSVRHHIDLEQQVGLFINTLPLRAQIDPDAPFLECLHTIADHSAKAFEHQEYPFDRMISDLQVARDTGRNPLFDVLLVLQDLAIGDGRVNVSHQYGFELSQLDHYIYGSAPVEYDQVSSKFDLAFHFGNDPGNRFYLDIQYATSLFNTTLINQFYQAWLHILTQVLDNPSTLIRQLEMVDEPGKEKLLANNNRGTSYPANKTITKLFEVQVAKTPGHTALVFGNNSLQYAQLNAVANQLANYLRTTFNIGADDVVGIKLERSEWMIIAILGVLKAGGAYLPIDAANPPDRIAYMLADSASKALIDEEMLQKFIATKNNYPAEDPASINTATNLAYVIYTSGSTGKPKGVMITHQSLVDYHYGITARTNINECQSFGLVSTIAADLGNTIIYTSLLVGGALHVFSAEAVRDPEIMLQARLDCLKIVPSHWKALQEGSRLFAPAKCLVFGGEQLTEDLIQQLINNKATCQVYNHYGPSETTIGKLIRAIELNNPVIEISLGTPFGNTAVYLLDADLQLVPAGIPGEICIAGDGLARGYLNNPALTAEKFVPDPFRPGERMYKTGDLGKWLPDGSIAFIGRKDDQVKIRGYRIELGEITSVLQEHPAIGSALVLGKTNEKGQTELVAWLVSKEIGNVSAIRSWLQERLPDYMLPHHLIRLDAWPLTPNGKIDKKALPAPEVQTVHTGAASNLPHNEFERQLVAVYEEVLNKRPISRQDDFFVLGGDSIKSIQIVSRLRQRGYTVTIQDMLVYPVIEELARRVKKVSRTSEQALVEGTIPLSPIQHLFFEHSTIENHHYNQSVLLDCKIRVSEEGIRKALDSILLHHDALRMVYYQGPEGWVQENRGASASCSLKVITEDNANSFIEICERIQASFHIEQGPLFKAALFRHATGDRLLLVAHHLVMDAVSWRILLEDLTHLYRQYLAGTPFTLPLKTDSFRDWQRQQIKYAASTALQQEEKYWSAMDAEEIPVFPVDHPTGTNLAGDTATCSFVLDTSTTHRLLTQCYKAWRTDINDLLVTGLGGALAEVLSIEKLRIRMEGHGREYIGADMDVSRSIGWFTTVYPVWIDLRHRGDKSTQLITIKEQLHRVPNKGIGYGILRYLAGRKYSAAAPVIFNYLGDLAITGTDNQTDALFELSDAYHGSTVAPQRPRNAVLEVLGMVVNGSLRIQIGYSTQQYEASTIEQIGAVYQQQLQELAEWLPGIAQEQLTPVDLTFKELSIAQLQKLNHDGHVEDLYPLSPLQEGLYYHWLSAPDSPLYFDQISYRIRKKLQPALVEETYRQLLSRHAIFRTYFTQELAAVSLQVVCKNCQPDFTWIDADDETAFSVEAYKAADRARGFDCHRPSQIRLAVIGLGDHQYEFIWSHHHILIDGWGVGVLNKEFFEIYDRLAAGAVPALDKVYPYSAYIKWLDNIDQSATFRYWQQYLAGYDTISTLPKISAAKPGHKARETSFVVEGVVRQSIAQLCIAAGVTENTFILAAWGLLLGRYTNRQDLVFGSIVSGRPAELKGVETMMGLFINTIPVRIRLTGSLTARQLLKEVQQDSIDGTSHHYMQLADIQAASELKGNLFDHLLVFQNYPLTEFLQQSMEHREGEDALTLLSVHTVEQTNYDFTITTVPGETISIKFDYNSMLYDEWQVERIKQHFHQLIGSLVQSPDAKVHELGYIDETEKQQLLETFNDTAILYPYDQTVVDLFEEQVARTPGKVAIIFGNRALTYRELDEQSNRLAHHLIENYGIRPEDTIAFLLDRSEKLLIAILAIVKAGGCYVPVDPDFPTARKEFILRDTAAKLLLTQSEYIFDLDYFQGEVFAIDIQLDNLTTSADACRVPLQPGNAIYIMYTSGSTGKPKGVVMEHRGVVRLVKPGDYLNITGTEILLSTGAVSFDATTFEYWGTLLNGGQLIICPKETLLDEQLLSAAFRHYGVNTMWFTSGWLQQLVDKNMELLSGLNAILTGGERLSPPHMERIRQHHPSMRLISVYGPTENTTFSSFYPIDTVADNIPIGKPINNSTMYILDAHQQLCGIGVPGEIWVGGDGVARGYLNNPELTAERFIPHPFQSTGRLYRSGDLGRWLPDGNIEFIGRVDAQVKIRGYRVELGEVEAVLESHPAISAAVVIARMNAAGEKELVAYMVSKEILHTTAVNDYAGKVLPDYMLPTWYVQLEQFPLMLNGKVDKKSLPDPESVGMETGVEYIAPRNATEEKLVMIWQELLGRERIGVKDNFFEIGGHSLKATRLASQLHKEFDVKVALKDLFINITPEEQAQLIEAAKKIAFVSIAPVPLQADYALSSAQQRLWVLSQLEEGNRAYNMAGAYLLEGSLNQAALEQAFQTLVERHESLRTLFKENEEGQVRQFIRLVTDIAFRIVYQDLRGEVITEEKIQALVQQDSQPFDLASDLLLSVRLYQLTDNKWVLSCVLHHIISDGWSMGVLVKEVSQLYNAYAKGAANPLSPLRIQYKDYAAWQQLQLAGESPKIHEAYWQQQFSGTLPVLEMPVDQARPSIKTYRGGKISRIIPATIRESLKTYCQEQGATLFMGLLAAVKTLLHRYTQQEDIIIGTPIAGRQHADLDGQIGFYLNTLALRTQLSGTNNFTQLVEKIKQVTVSAFEHQVYPFEALIDALDLPRDTGRHPLFDVMMVLQNTDDHRAEEGQLDGLSIHLYEGATHVISKFDLVFAFEEVPAGLQLNIEYNSDIYYKNTATQLAAHLEQLLGAILKEPSIPVHQLSFLNETEKEQLLFTFNNTNADWPAHKTIVELFEEQVVLTPGHVALVFETTSLTYRELNERANLLAHYLRTTYDIQREDLVGIRIERSEWMVISILGILKSGGAYMPMEPAYPQERITYMIADSNCKAVIDEEVLTLFSETAAQYTSDNPQRVNQPQDIAYVIYTSGTTGKPKGSLIEHRNVVRLLKTSEPLFDFGSDDVWTMFHSYCFDFSVWEMYGALLFGGKLVVIPALTAKDPANYLQVLNEQKVTVLNQTPSAFYNLIKAEAEKEKAGLSLRYIIFGGEALSPGKLATWQQRYPVTELINMYGITETTVHVTYKKITAKEIINNSSNIGTPIPTLTCYVLDPWQQLLPVGVWGELYVGGAGVCRGYLNKPALTSGRFLSNPFRPGERLYRSGDKARLLANGEMEYVGRLDDQVKIRGHRIELGEITNVLLSMDNIEDAVLITRTDAHGENNIVAYIISQEILNTAAIRQALSTQLPAYMLPAYFVQVENFPLTSNGKVDKKRLPDPAGMGMQTGREYIAPRNATEEKLVMIWQEILGREPISVQDVFFECGGHSLKATRLASLLHKEFDVKLSLKELFIHVTPEAQARLIDAGRKNNFLAIEPAAIQPHYPLSSSQRRLWVLSQLEEGNAAYNMAGSYVFEGTLDTGALQPAFQQLIIRHESLRTVFREDEQGTPCQFILEPGATGFSVLFHDIRNESLSEETIKTIVQATRTSSFDLVTGPLLRVELYQLADNRWIFVCVLHHIISDGWSMGILVKELLLLYNAHTKNETNPLSPLRIQYKDYACWQQQQLGGETIAAHKKYWLQQFQGELPVLELPTDRARPAVKTYRGGAISKKIPAALQVGLQSLCREQGSTLFMGLLGVVNVLLHKYTHQEDFIVGSPIAGRGHADLENQLGFYVNTLALRTTCTGEQHYLALLNTIKEVTLHAYEHQVYPFDELVDALQLPRDTARHPLFDVMMVLQNAANPETTVYHPHNLQVTRYEGSDQVISKFDLVFVFEELPEGLQLNIEYNSDIYNKTTAERMAAHLEQLLSVIVAEPFTPIRNLNYLSVAEKQQLLSDFNATTTPWPGNKTIVELFEEQVERVPGRIALVFEGKSLSYRELHERSNQLAYYLQNNYQVQRGDLVGILLERSEWIIISILGILKAGGAYIPIDPAYPPQRIDYMVADSHCKLVIDANELAIFGKENIEQHPLPSHSEANDIAYIMYTSGTTGQPKGVVVEHRSVTRLVKSATANYVSFTGKEILLSTGAVSFDATTFEYWGALLNGGRLVLCSRETLLDEQLLATCIQKNEVNIMWFTAGWLHQLADKDINIFNSLQTIVAGGDKLSPVHIQRIRQQYPAVQVVNGYGPTENTTFSLCYSIHSVTDNIPVGKPINNSTAYILDNYQQLCGIGITGEICVGGAGLARGYHNNATLTTEKFIPHPWLPGERLYRTGDLGRWLPDGNIEFTGRLDAQVKIRGYRVELGEIESILQNHPDIDAAVVITRPNATGEKELVAYLVGKGSLNTSTISVYAGSFLPAYMVPAWYVQVDELPLTPNGKVDKQRLPDPAGMGMDTGVTYIAPRNSTEEKLVAIWQEILGREPISVKDDFFACGGHSLKATRLAGRIQQTFDVKLPLKEIFTTPVLEDQAILITQAVKTIFRPIPIATVQDDYAVSSSQRRLWMLSRFEEGNRAYNMPFAYTFEGRLDQGALERAFSTLIERHESLCTIFKEDEQGHVRQFIAAAGTDFRITHFDLRADLAPEEKATALITQEVSRPFDLSAEILLRVQLYQLAGNKWIFLCVLHHIVSDGWSMGNLVKEIVQLYNAFTNKEENPLSPLRIQYKDYAAWQQEQLQAVTLQAHKTYWLQQFKGTLPVMELPCDHVRPLVKTYAGGIVHTNITAADAKALQLICREQGGTLFMGLLTAVKTLLYRYTGQQDLIVGTPIAGREHPDLESQIGFYVNTLALRTIVAGENNFRELFDKVKQVTVNAYEHQSYPFDELVNDLALPVDMSRNALFDVMVVLQDPDNSNAPVPPQLGNIDISGFGGINNTSSKFDLFFSFVETGEGLQAGIEYNKDIYDHTTVTQLAHHFTRLLHGLVQQPSTPVGQLDYLSIEEKQRLVTTFNNTELPFDRDKTIIGLFEEQVTNTPDAIALVYEATTLTYRQLQERSSHFSRYLRSHYGITSNDLVGIQLERTEWMVIAILGVLKCGAAYVPIDPEYPQERIGYMIADSQCSLVVNETVINDSKHHDDLPDHILEEPVYNSTGLFSLMYTTGSTGRPKGIAISHINLHNRLQWMWSAFPFREQEICVAKTSISFGDHWWEIFGPLLKGVPLVIFNKLAVLDTEYFIAQLAHHRVTRIVLVPSLLKALLVHETLCAEKLGLLKEWTSSGELLDKALIEKFYAVFPGHRLLNIYGSTEVTADATYFDTKNNNDQYAKNIHSCIGRPIANASVYILNDQQQLVPERVMGEICVGGEGISFGYIRQPALMQEQFLDDPFKPGGRIYRTGDLGRWLPDGTIEYLGRKDAQVKIRGHRIELREVELALQSHPGIDAVAVAAREDDKGEKRLVAYMVGKQPLKAAELRAHIGKVLPAYFLPEYFVQLDKLPLNANGKIDRKNLPPPENIALPTGTAYLAPRNEVESTLVEIWSHIAGIHKEKIGVKDNFFESGGHSLKLTRLASQIHKAFAVKVDLKDVFANPTIETVSDLIRAGKWAESSKNTRKENINTVEV